MGLPACADCAPTLRWWGRFPKACSAEQAFPYPFPLPFPCPPCPAPATRSRVHDAHSRPPSPAQTPYPLSLHTNEHGS
jgi:hypothetical protein